MCRSQKGFSLIELLVVVGVIATLLAMGAAVVGGSRGESRQAVKSLALGFLTNAQNEALTTGKPIAVVMVPYDAGREEHFGRAMAIFEVRQDEVTGDYTAGEQRRRWTSLPGRYLFSKGAPISTEGQNAFDQAPIVEVPYRGSEGAGELTFNASAIIFDGTGKVAWPNGSGELELHFEEGVIQRGAVVGTSASSATSIEEWQKREIIIIGRQTGRARILKF